VLLVLGMPAMAYAQASPTKVITIVVPFAAGGPTDTVTRLLAQSMSKTLGQQVIVENVGGGRRDDRRRPGGQGLARPSSGPRAVEGYIPNGAALPAR
jgi:hypothetical protein